jgi:SpoVK/Ycf46/Vps4 family AAA+-type ATPase
MARADLLIDLVKYAITGNKSMIKKVTEAIIAEERNKQHTILADKLENELHKAPVVENNQNTSPFINNSKSSLDYRAENLITEVSPVKKLADLVLPTDVINISEQFIKEQYRVDLLRSYALEPRNKILLIGPPGNGKTSLAEALAESLMLPLYLVKYDSLIGAYLGETASRLRKLMDYVSSRKCILFFDEFETLGKERGDIHETGEIKRVVSSLLLQIDNLPSHVIVIGATNHPELLDRAVWRRFQIKMTLPLPTRINIVLWLDKFQHKHKIRFEYASETIAKKMMGINYAELEEFGLSVLRQYVLSLPDSNMKAIVSAELKSRTNIVIESELPK